jgi:translation initiation factor 1
MSTITNLASKDPFADDDFGLGDFEAGAPGKIHIRIQKRNGRKSVTTVQGLSSALDLKKILKVFKKELCCNGTVHEDEKAGQVLQLQGDQRQFVLDFLVKEDIAKKEDIVVHGF